MNISRPIEKAIAVGSFLTAAALAFTSLLISPEYDVASNVMFVIAQFLTLTATILGIDYKFGNYGKNNHSITTTPRDSE